MNGEAMAEKNVNKKDEQVMKIFTNMISNFARNSEVKIEMDTNEDSGDVSSKQTIILPSFLNTNDDSYLSISSEPKIKKNFR